MHGAPTARTAAAPGSQQHRRDAGTDAVQIQAAAGADVNECASDGSSLWRPRRGRGSATLRLAPAAAHRDGRNEEHRENAADHHPILDHPLLRGKHGSSRGAQAGALDQQRCAENLQDMCRDCWIEASLRQRRRASFLRSRAHVVPMHRMQRLRPSGTSAGRPWQACARRPRTRSQRGQQQKRQARESRAAPRG
jgi:hypothetical protein